MMYNKYYWRIEKVYIFWTMWYDISISKTIYLYFQYIKSSLICIDMLLSISIFDLHRNFSPNEPFNITDNVVLWICGRI